MTLNRLSEAPQEWRKTLSEARLKLLSEVRRKLSEACLKLSDQNPHTPMSFRSLEAATLSSVEATDDSGVNAASQAPRVTRSGRNPAHSPPPCTPPPGKLHHAYTNSEIFRDRPARQPRLSRLSRADASCSPWGVGRLYRLPGKSRIWLKSAILRSLRVSSWSVRNLLVSVSSIIPMA